MITPAVALTAATVLGRLAGFTVSSKAWQQAPLLQMS
jgi:hypothetical protein